MITLLTFDVAFFGILIFLTFSAIIIHRAHALHNTSRKGAVDGTYWGAYSTAATPAPVPTNKKDHAPRIVNGKLVLPKVQKGTTGALAGKSTYAGRR
ncbi:MAG: hypothetical protein JSS86_12795 [Cyanobacteria bacterium SZAS LIN-2]|nr:hypothetical protein [Cyanobacteria bacterium SZAS LIN-2]